MMGFNLDLFEGALHAADINAIRGFLARDADPVGVLPDGWTALHHIAFIEEVNPHGEYARAVELIVEAGGDVNAKESGNGETPLHFAVSYCRRTDAGLAVVRALLKAGADPNCRDAAGGTPLHHCVATCRRDCEMETTRIPEILGALLDAGANVAAADMCGQSPLHIAAGCGQTEAVEILVAAGANVNGTCVHGLTPLHRAIQEGQSWIVRRLLTLGADPNLADHGGESSLHHAARGEAMDEWGCPKSTYETIIDALIEAGANPRKRNAKGMLPCEVATLPWLRDRLCPDQTK